MSACYLMLELAQKLPGASHAAAVGELHLPDFLLHSA